MERSNHIVKNIEIQQKFADLIFKEFRSKRFGINTCCSIDQKNKYNIQKALCDWENKKKPYYKKEYTETNWVNCTKPIPEWIQYGDYAPAETNCPPCQEYPPVVPQPCWATINFKKEHVVLWPNESGSAKLVALCVTPHGTTPPTDEDWMVVGECTFPTFTAVTNDDGSISYLSTDTTDGNNCDWIEDPDDPKTSILRYKVYADDDTIAGKTGAIKSDLIKWVIVDPVAGEKKLYDFKVWTGDWQATVNLYNIYPNPSECTPPESFYNYNNTVPNTIELICDEDPCERCVFCGEGWPPIGTPTTPIDGTDPAVDIDQAPICICDSECLYITVKDACGKAVPNWEINLDGGLIGQTNDEGIFTYTIDKASVNTKHALDICGFCFTTTGNCNQKKIDIVIDDGSECTCTNPEHHCYIRKEDDCSFTPLPPVPPNWIQL